MSLQVGQTATPKLPWKLKKQLKALSSEPSSKVNPAGSPSRKSRSTPTQTHSRRKEPSSRTVPARERGAAAHNASPKVLAEIGRKLQAENKGLYEMVCDRQYELHTLLTVIIAATPFRATLNKYRTHKAYSLMRQVAEYLRIQRDAEQLAALQKREEPKTPSPKKAGPSAAQKAQSERDKAAARAARSATQRNMTTVRPRAKRAKGVRPREIRSDERIVKEALDRLFQEDEKLRMMFCRASEAGQANLLRTNKQIERFIRRVRTDLAKPSRVTYLVREAVRSLVKSYNAEAEAAKQQADEVAVQRRERERRLAEEASRARVQAISRAQNPGITRQLRRQISSERRA